MCLNGMPWTYPKLTDFLSLTVGDTIRNNLGCKGMYKKKNGLTHKALKKRKEGTKFQHTELACRCYGRKETKLKSDSGKYQLTQQSVIGPPKICSSTKALRKLAKIVRIISVAEFISKYFVLFDSIINGILS